MSTLNDLLAELNGSVNNDAVTPFTLGVLAEAFAQRRQKRQERLIAAAVNVTEAVETGIASLVDNLRRIRKQEKDAKNSLDKANRAAKYFAATGNPLPYYDAIGARYRGADYCSTVGAEVPGKDDPLWTVPADWQEPVEAPKS